LTEKLNPICYIDPTYSNTDFSQIDFYLSTCKFGHCQGQGVIQVCGRKCLIATRIVYE